MSFIYKPTAEELQVMRARYVWNTQNSYRYSLSDPTHLVLQRNFFDYQILNKGYIPKQLSEYGFSYPYVGVQYKDPKTALCALRILLDNGAIVGGKFCQKREEIIEFLKHDTKIFDAEVVDEAVKLLPPIDFLSMISAISNSGLVLGLPLFMLGQLNKSNAKYSFFLMSKLVDQICSQCQEWDSLMLYRIRKLQAKLHDLQSWNKSNRSYLNKKIQKIFDEQWYILKTNQAKNDFLHLSETESQDSFVIVPQQLHYFTIKQLTTLFVRRLSILMRIMCPSLINMYAYLSEHENVEQFDMNRFSYFKTTQGRLSNPFADVPEIEAKQIYQEFTKRLYRQKEVLQKISVWKEDDDTILDYLPAEFRWFSNIKEIFLPQFNVQVFPRVVLKLKSLESLHLQMNCFETIPKKIGDLTNLTELELSGYEGFALPLEFNKLTKLISLDLEHTKLVDFSCIFVNLTNLTYLSLRGCTNSRNFDGIGNLIQLKALDLSNTKLPVLPQEILRLTKLEKLDLERYEFQNDLSKPTFSELWPWKELPDGILEKLQYLNKESVKEISAIQDEIQDAAESIDASAAKRVRYA